MRHLYKPRRALKEIQKKVSKLLSQVPIADSVHGWVRGKSIKTAAQHHIGNCYLYHYDIDDYFDSVGSKLVYRLFVSELGCSPEIGKILTKLTTYKYSLPQGSPCSTSIANLVLSGFDSQITQYVSKRTGVYTRFGDNIIISSRNRLPDVKWVVETSLRRVGLKMNKGKEINAARIQRNGVKVIGIVIGSRLTVSRKFRNVVRAIMHQTKAQSSNLSLLGKIRFVQQFHPEFNKV